MTNVNGHEISSCGFGEQLAAYLYNEIDAPEKSRFESHLNGCAICRDELLDFSALRSTISDWRAHEFEFLNTPTFVLPVARENSPEKRSWFAALQEFFTLSPARAVVFAAVALLIVSAGIFLTTSNHSTDQDLAKTENVEKNSLKKEIEQNEISAPIPDATPQIQEKPVNAVKSSAPIKNNSAPAKVSSSPATVKTQPNSSAPNQIPRVKTPIKNAPALENDDDEDDNSLRLSDMFEEIGMNNSGNNSPEENINNE